MLRPGIWARVLVTQLVDYFFFEVWFVRLTRSTRSLWEIIFIQPRSIFRSRSFASVSVRGGKTGSIQIRPSIWKRACSCSPSLIFPSLVRGIALLELECRECAVPIELLFVFVAAIVEKRADHTTVFVEYDLLEQTAAELLVEDE